jgi:integrase
MEKQFLSESPVKGIKYYKHNQELSRVPTFVPPQHIKELREKAKKYSPGFFYPVFLMVTETAAKTSEIACLKWEDVDLKNRTINLQGLRLLSARSIKISEEFASVLEQKKRISEFVFTNIYGKQFSKMQLGCAMTAFKRHCKVKDRWMYFDLRHSYAKNHLDKGGSMKELQRILGIHSMETAREIYGHFQKSKLSHKSPVEIGA